MDSAAEIAVSLAGVWKRYHQRQRSARFRDVLTNLVRPRRVTIEALCGIDLTIPRGQIVAYAGPNGAGKSTTIKLLSSLLAPDAGTVRVLGMDPVRDRVRYVGRIGVVFGQRTELWWDHPIAASFAWKRVVWNVPQDRYERMLGLVRELLDLEELMPALARELSLGQRMRCDLALSLLHEPEVLLLDEPTLGLDVLSRRRILGFVREVSRERGMTVVVTSHDMDELEQLAGRIVLLHRGRLAFDGDFERLRRESSDRRVLRLQVESGRVPHLEGAERVGGEGDRHEFVYDASRVRAAPAPRRVPPRGTPSTSRRSSARRLARGRGRAAVRRDRFGRTKSSHKGDDA